ncbi:MAG: hypothetical protein RIQ99_1925, partial [Pseudomonadota bacterium]
SQELWRRMEASGDLYLDRYEGWYSIRDEAYYDESELTAGEGGEKLSPQGTPVEWTVEESWFFRLSKYADRLLALYRDQPDFIRPESRRNEVTRFVEGGLRDLSVSRTSFDWGVKVPGSDGHVMYVWVDALTNYLTGLGFPDESGDFAKYWPANLHLIGKDITRFHTIYWPAFLWSAGIDLPRHVREVAFGQDGSYSPEAIVTRTNAELANSFGNLAQRSLSMIFKNLDGQLRADLPPSEADQALLGEVETQVAAMVARFGELAFSDGLECWMRAVFACNQYVDDQAPWALRKTDPDRMAAVLMVLFRCVRSLAIAVRPVVPASADKLLDQMGIAAGARDFAALDHVTWLAELVASGFVLAQPFGVFPRLELPVEDAA